MSQVITDGSVVMVTWCVLLERMQLSSLSIRPVCLATDWLAYLLSYTIPIFRGHETSELPFMETSLPSE